MDDELLFDEWVNYNINNTPEYGVAFEWGTSVRSIMLCNVLTWFGVKLDWSLLPVHMKYAS